MCLIRSCLSSQNHHCQASVGDYGMVKHLKVNDRTISRSNLKVGDVKICEMHSTFVCVHIYCALLYVACKYYIISVGLAEMGSKELTLKAGIPGH